MSVPPISNMKAIIAAPHYSHKSEKNHFQFQIQAALPIPITELMDEQASPVKLVPTLTHCSCYPSSCAHKHICTPCADARCKKYKTITFKNSIILTPLIQAGITPEGDLNCNFHVQYGYCFLQLILLSSPSFTCFNNPLIILYK